MQQHTHIRRRSRTEVCDAFIQGLRARGTTAIVLDSPGVIEGIQRHFQLLPTRYALDVNITSLDVLNHKRLLESARADPSAVSFQVRPVDVVLPAGAPPAYDRQPSFGNMETLLQSEVHPAPRKALQPLQGVPLAHNVRASVQLIENYAILTAALCWLAL